MGGKCKTFPYFYLSFYRRPKYPGELTKKPVVVIHFYEVPENPADKFWMDPKFFKTKIHVNKAAYRVPYTSCMPLFLRPEGKTMFQKLFAWLKKQGFKQIIRQMDELEEPFALKIKEAQKVMGSISPEEFSKLIVDDVQRMLCKKVGIDPAELEL